MVVAMIPMIEPALVRMFYNVLPESINHSSYYLTILVVDLIIFCLVISDFRNLKVRGIFQGLLITMIVFQTIILSGMTESNWIVSLASWYADLGK